jgi:mRNA-degrading endonuclease RelE of RelBE toxin-antitoxin system
MSKWQVVILKPAERYLNSLFESDRNKILDALRMLQENPTDRKYKKLKGRAEWSLRVGQRRILFRTDSKNKHFVVTGIGPRDDIYK